MEKNIELEISSLLPGVENDHDGCIKRLETALQNNHKMQRAHLERGEGPVIASTDYVKLFADQIRTSVPNRYSVLGTDGFGRSDLRRTLRSFFEVDRHFVTIAALKALADENKIPSTKVADAIAMYGIDPEKPNPSRS